MSRYMVVGVLAGISSFLIEGATAVMASTTMSAEASAVIAAEEDWIRAEIDRDEKTLRRVIDDQFVANSNDGQTSGKEALIENVLSWNMTGQTISERSVLVAGDTAVIFGTTEMQFASPGEAATTSRLRYTATYVRRGGQWRAIALHMAQRSPQT